MGWWLSHWLQLRKLVPYFPDSSSPCGICSLVFSFLAWYVALNFRELTSYMFNSHIHINTFLMHQLKNDPALQQIPIWWRWYYWLSPVAWTLYGLVTSQVGDIEGNVEIPGSTATMTVKQLLKDSFGFKYDFLPVVAVVKLVWLLAFVFVFTLAITLINFQRR